MELYNSLEGKSCNFDHPQVTSVEELRDLTCKQLNIQPANLLILVPPSGTQLKDLSSRKGFVFDRQWAQEPSRINELINEGDSNGDPNICVEATELAIANLDHNMQVVSKQLNKLVQAQAQLDEDIKTCGRWGQYYEALQQIPKLNEQLPELVDKSNIEKNCDELTQLSSKTREQIEQLRSTYTVIKGNAALSPAKPTDSLIEARRNLLNTLKSISEVQLSVKLQLRIPLSALASDLKHAVVLKEKAANVVDIPFLYGALMIEANRRQRFKTDLGPIWQRELERRQEWLKHYMGGSLGPLFEKLDRIGGFNIFGEGMSMDLASLKLEDRKAESLADYLRMLEALKLDDVCQDLRNELSAMRRQFARSMTDSINSLMPDSMLLGGGALTESRTLQQQRQSIPASVIEAYEARIRKLETIVMQSKMGSKSYDLDILRAETRAEARAEARAEVKAEQQQARIAELEKQKTELSTRLSEYVNGLEAVLNSMGLQTSRVDPVTGVFGTYQINRVKGLSRHVNPPQSGNSQDAKSSSSNESDSNLTYHSGSSNFVDPTRTLPLDRLLEQTFVDNQILFEAVSKRFGEVERLARKLQVENRRLRDRDAKMERDLRQRVALHSFRPEDLILFLPTRDNRRQPNPWAAFNADAPHYFLHPRHAEQLQNRDYLIARASSIERHVAEDNEENLFQLPPGTEWYLISIHGEWGV